LSAADESAPRPRPSWLSEAPPIVDGESEAVDRSYENWEAASSCRGMHIVCRATSVEASRVPGAADSACSTGPGIAHLVGRAFLLGRSRPAPTESASSAASASHPGGQFCRSSRVRQRARSGSSRGMLQEAARSDSNVHDRPTPKRPMLPECRKNLVSTPERAPSGEFP